MPDQLEFKISSALKNIIGRDLITDDFIAVFELVKNSYDAFAEKVTITFEADKIIIADDGKGMSLSDLKNKWLFVAYSAKSDGTEDNDLEEIRGYRDKIKSKRYYAGAKGIGRFSCDRLGRKLKLITRKINNKNFEQLDVDWGKFEQNPEQEFVDISVEHDTLGEKSLKSFKHGTILEITHLLSFWNRDKIKRLKHSLEKLIDPFGSPDGNNINEFSIEIICNRELEADKEQKRARDKVNGPVNNFIFETLNIKTTQIVTKIDKTNIFTEFIDRGDLIYSIKEPNEDYPLLDQVNFHLYFLNKIAKTNFTRLMGLQPYKFGTVFLFKNGFRVHPFGEEGDDTLGIDYRHAQGYARTLGTRDLIGRIEIFSNSSEFKEISSRDGGLVKTNGYHQLLDCFKEKCLKRLEKYVVEIQWAYKLDPSLQDDKLREDTALLKTVFNKSRIAKLINRIVDNEDVELLEYNKSFLSIANDNIEEVEPEVFYELKKFAEKTGDDDFLTEIVSVSDTYLRMLLEKQEAEKKAKEADEAREKAEQEKREAEEQLELERQKNTYLFATRKTLSSDAEGLIHGIKINTININESVERLLWSVKEKRSKEKDIIEELSKIKFFSDRVLKISTLITRANFRSDKDKQSINISKYIVQYLTLYSEIYDETRLAFEIVDKGSSLIKKVSVLELSIVLDNLISNAEKWGARKVLVELSNLNDGRLEILFSDNGEGVIEKFLKKPGQMFELGVTESTGSGIGLHTVKDTLKGMRAEVSFVGNGVKSEGATFRILFNK